MGDPRKGTRDYRRQVAARAITAANDWVNAGPASTAPLSPVVIGDLLSCAQWLHELLTIAAVQNDDRAVLAELPDPELLELAEYARQGSHNAAYVALRAEVERRSGGFPR